MVHMRQRDTGSPYIQAPSGLAVGDVCRLPSKQKPRSAGWRISRAMTTGGHTRQARAGRPSEATLCSLSNPFTSCFCSPRFLGAVGRSGPEVWSVCLQPIGTRPQEGGQFNTHQSGHSLLTLCPRQERQQPHSALSKNGWPDLMLLKWVYPHTHSLSLPPSTEKTVSLCGRHNPAT